MKLKTLILLGPLIFLIHDLEEVFTVESWIKTHQNMLKDIEIAQNLIQNAGYSTTSFALTVAFIFSFFLLISYYASRSNDGWGMSCFVAALIVLFVNAFTHLAQTILFRMYTPGVITALMIVLPYTIFTFRILKREGLLSKSAIINSLAIGLFFVPIIFAPLFILKKLFS